MSIFREKALKRLSSPENLDEALVAASPFHWVAYAAAALLVGITVAWGFLGEVPTRVNADGILLHRDSEVFSASAEGSGELIEIRVRLGDHVEAGETVAVLDQDVDVLRLETARDKLSSAEARREADLVAQDEDVALRASLTRKERASLQEKITNARARLVNLEALVADMRRLLDRGFIERSRLLARENEQIQVREMIADLKNALVKLEVQDRERAEYWKDRMQASDKEIEAYEDEIDNIREHLRRIRTVDAPISGTVTEISASLGDVVAAGKPVVRIVSEASEMDALLFVPPADGKLIKSGMTANVEPTVAKKEEFGTIVSTVRSVSDLPMSASAIQAMLHNEKLVQRFTSKGSPVAIRADLNEVAGETERFLWTGGAGPDFDVEQGTLIAATITVRRQRPVTLILPFLKSFVGL
ncbi:NHLP bacteriocin system secretion protein [Nisaea denitrificans]|uniref:NHLP bacteriocin system secretion protein n=1 Tax=Nisaea denitrificans TaxID=390877 RepID=UPI000404AB16|nr:NHLP bacteriocin system secretion protein [Nisaea denitrificans]